MPPAYRMMGRNMSLTIHFLHSTVTVNRSELDSKTQNVIFILLGAEELGFVIQCYKNGSNQTAESHIQYNNQINKNITYKHKL